MKKNGLIFTFIPFFSILSPLQLPPFLFFVNDVYHIGWTGKIFGHFRNLFYIFFGLTLKSVCEPLSIIHWSKNVVLFILFYFF
jgi:hypothetical protein